jgi:hypothetical protein
MQTSDLIPSPNTSTLGMELQVAVIQVHLLHPVTQCLLMASLRPVMAITMVLLHHHPTDITEVRLHHLPISTTPPVSRRPKMGITEVHHHLPMAIIHLDRLLVAIMVLVIVHIGSLSTKCKGGMDRY